MPPKTKKGSKKAQKGKQQDDWSDNEMGDLQSLNAKLGLQPLSDSEDESPEEQAKPAKSLKPSGTKSDMSASFSALNIDDAADTPDQPPADTVGDSDDGEGLMAQLNKAAKTKDKKKGKKNKPQRALSDDEQEQQQEDEDADPKPESSGPVAVAADDLWNSDEDAKPKKGKKGKKQQPQSKDEPAEPNDDEAAPDEPSRPLSKKEKEKLKKQRQKEAEKAKKAKQKPAATPSGTASPAPEPQTPANEHIAAEDPADDGAGDDAPTTSAKDKKKKKKKGAKDSASEAPAAESKPGKAPKVSKAVAAMREAMEARQRAEEQAKQAEEERLRKIKEEEEREEEEKAKVEAARLAKKQKQKEKEQAQKAAGTFKSAAQKKADAKVAAQRQAMLAAGFKVAGMEDNAAAKKPVYGKKKPQTKAKEETPPVESEPVKAAEPESAAAQEDDLQDSWDASEKEDEDEDVKDDWDAESEEEVEQPEVSKPAPTAGTAKKEPPAKGPAKAEPKAAPSKSNGKASAASAKNESSSEEESSEEEEDSDEETDSSEEDSEEETDSEEDSDDELTPAQRREIQRKAELAERKKQRVAAAKAAQSKDDLRSPICCILGHVDTGKTKLLDKIRQSNVQEGEAGGITQQIGATFFPVDRIKQKTQVLGEADLKEYKIPGLLVIDTPGHESFTNLRTRGSSLCNIAILVVDIVHGLEPQTLESLRLLRDRKTPFIVALNKIDRMFEWQVFPGVGFHETFAKQKKHVQSEFKTRLERTMLEFAEQGLNALPYYENKDMGRTVSLVPTSAVTGEGVPDLLMLLVKLTQERMTGSLMYLSELECTVLEVKVIEGFGTTIDVVLSNGVLREGDRVVVCTLKGPVVTQIRALLTPQPLKELRIKGSYVHHKEVKAALGVKIAAPDLDKAIAGSRLLLVTEDDDEEQLKEDVMQDLTQLLNSFQKGRGVHVQASTLGALEALLDFLKSMKIPVGGVNIGPVHKRDVIETSVMVERAPELAVMLCFDVPVEKEAEKIAEEFGIKIFKADIIYHLFDAFVAHNKAVLEAKQRDSAAVAIWPCRLKTLACFAKRDPIILGCDLIEGQLRVGTPLGVIKQNEQGQKEIISLGRVTSLQINHRPYQKVFKRDVGAGVAVKIEHAVYEPARMFGRHFEESDEIVSLLSRQSIDTLKELFRDEVSKDEWMMIKKMKPLLGID